TVRACPRRPDLAPASLLPPGNEHGHARPEEVVLVVYLDKLERRARAVTPPLRLLDVRIVELALQPAGRGDLAALRRAQLHGELAAAAPLLRAAAFAPAYHLLMSRIGSSP